jgi:hypothetical protein
MFFEKILRLGIFPFVLITSYLGDTNLFSFTRKVPCLFQYLFDFDCFGCGITRSLILLLHGDFLDSFNMHLLGVPVFCCLLVSFIHELRNLNKGEVYV